MFSLFLAEFVGTMILIFLGDSVVANVVLKKTNGNNSGWIVITAGWAFAIGIAAYVVGGISGAHLNPAFSLALVLIGAMPASNLLIYVIAQFLGAMAGAGLVYLMYKKQFDEVEGPVLGIFCTGPLIRDKFWNIVSEVLATATAVFVILGVTAARNQLGYFATFMVSIIVWSMGLSLGGPTGYAINPARDLGPRLMHQLLPIPNKASSDWDYAIVPTVGPIIGAIMGAFLFTICNKIWG